MSDSGRQDESGYVNTLHVISRDGGGSTFHPETIEVRNEHIICTEEVEMMALDEYELDEDVGLIKIDVEGHELNVMRGGIETILRSKCPILFESWTDDWNKACKKELFSFVRNKLGYKINQITEFPHMFLATYEEPTGSSMVDRHTYFSHLHV